MWFFANAESKRSRFWALRSLTVFWAIFSLFMRSRQKVCYCFWLSIFTLFRHSSDIASNSMFYSDFFLFFQTKCINSLLCFLKPIRRVMALFLRQQEQRVHKFWFAKSTRSRLDTWQLFTRWWMLNEVMITHHSIFTSSKFLFVWKDAKRFFVDLFVWWLVILKIFFGGVSSHLQRERKRRRLYDEKFNEGNCFLALKSF